MEKRRPASTLLTVLSTSLLAVALLGSTGADAAPSAKPAQIALNFIGVYQNDIPIKIKDFTFSKLPVVCNEASGTYDNLADPLPAMAVKNLKFKGKFTKKDLTTNVTGKYKKSLKKVTGTLQVRGDIAQYTGCKSPKIRWKTN